MPEDEDEGGAGEEETRKGSGNTCSCLLPWCGRSLALMGGGIEYLQGTTLARANSGSLDYTT